MYTVHWLNEDGKRKEPYDFEVRRAGADGVHRWVEVKATTSKAAFFWSVNELASAHRAGPAYMLLHVSGYGDPYRAPLVRRIDNAIAAVRVGTVPISRAVVRLPV